MSDRPPVVATIYLVEKGEYSDRKPYVACSFADVAVEISRLCEPDPEFERTPSDVRHAHPVPLWEGEEVPPHRTLYRIGVFLTGPISQHNPHCQLTVHYSTEVHWPWDCYKGWPSIASIEVVDEAKELSEIRAHLGLEHGRKRGYGVNQPVYVLEGYSAGAVLFDHRARITVWRNIYLDAGILWPDSPLTRQILDGGPVWEPKEPEEAKDG